MAPRSSRRTAGGDTSEAAKLEKVLAGLGEALGLQQASQFEVAKAVAESLCGLQVADDGATTLREDRAQGRRPKRARAAKASEEEEADDDDEEEAAAAAEEDGSEEGDEEGGSEEEEEEDDDDEGGGDYRLPGAALLLSYQLDTLFVNPVTVDDPRGPEHAPPARDVLAAAARTDGADAFAWLVSPLDPESFWDAIFEQQPAVINRAANRSIYAGLLGKADIEALLASPAGLTYGHQLDVVKYDAAADAKVFFNHNGPAPPPGGARAERVDAATVWRRFAEGGCSLRLLHPQRLIDPVWRLLAALEAQLGSAAGANAYLTPAGHQGFAPHWDDIDAFVLQLEGAKTWRLRAPAEPGHVLPRHASRDIKAAELGDVTLEVTLRPGDLLYLPRGCVHEAVAATEADGGAGHSLHLTVSANQGTTWAAFLERALPAALAAAAAESVELRRCLPRGYSEYMGAQHDPGNPGEDEDAGSDAEPAEEDARREQFRELASTCIEAVLRVLPLDATADGMAADFMRARLPPPGLAPRSAAAAAAAGAAALPAGARLAPAAPGVARMVVDEGGDEPTLVVVHCLSNARGAHAAGGDGEGAAPGEAEGEADGEGALPPELEFPLACADALRALLCASAEEPAVVGELPEVDEDAGVTAAEVAGALHAAGLLVEVDGK